MNSVTVINETNPISLVLQPTWNSISLTLSVGCQQPLLVGGYPFVIDDLQNQDMLIFGGAAWNNTPKTNITDGGNY